jgi:uncharacterized iron-regulated membrane protein
MLARRVLFQIHLWTGLALGLYIVAICVSGSVLVYRNELYRALSPEPVVVNRTGAGLSDQALSDAARRAYPGYEVATLRRGQVDNQAVEIELQRGEQSFPRLFDPFTGRDLGHPIPAGYRFTSWLLDFHDNLLAGDTGRRVNGIGALLVLVLCMTGAVIWWPWKRNWRRSLTVDVRARSRRITCRTGCGLAWGRARVQRFSEGAVGLCPNGEARVSGPW